MESMGEQSQTASTTDSEDHQAFTRTHAPRLRNAKSRHSSPDDRSRAVATAINRLEQEHVALLMALCDLEEKPINGQDAVVAAALQVLLRDELRHTQHALTLAATGAYGVCEVCQRPLSRRHLSLIPAITRCAACSGHTPHQH